jgi:hypothetical protein
MKTTVDIDDDVLRAAKLAAVQRQTTLRDLIQQGLLKILATESSESFRFRDASVGGSGSELWERWDERQRLAAMYGDSP